MENTRDIDYNIQRFCKIVVNFGLHCGFQILTYNHIIISFSNTSLQTIEVPIIRNQPKYSESNSKYFQINSLFVHM